MGIIRGVSKAATTVLGGAGKLAVKGVGKAIVVKNKEVGKYVEEIGVGIIDASKSSIDNVAQFADGTIRGTYGIVKNNPYHKQKGWNDIKESSTRTVKGVASGINYIAKSAGLTIRGLKNSNKTQLNQGLKNLGKVAAVTTFAVGLVDIIDGVDGSLANGFETGHKHPNGFDHNGTEVPFQEGLVELPNGHVYEGNFPVFDSPFSVNLVEEMYLKSDQLQFHIANDTLYHSIQENPSLAKVLDLSPGEVQALQHNITPEGYVWHHHQQPGVLQLINEETHQHTHHIGGRELWGGGSEYR
ncbi:HNH endonuclease [Bacillus sp. MM2020_1]|nr:HNH endonuclease [Bacillus sp. MM2020_1]